MNHCSLPASPLVPISHVGGVDPFCPEEIGPCAKKIEVQGGMVCLKMAPACHFLRSEVMPTPRTDRATADCLSFPWMSPPLRLLFFLTLLWKILPNIGQSVLAKLPSPKNQTPKQDTTQTPGLSWRINWGGILDPVFTFTCPPPFSFHIILPPPVGLRDFGLSRMGGGSEAVI